MYVKHLFLAILLIIALALGCAFVRTFAFPDASWPLDKGERAVILPGETLTQPFAANGDGLRRVEILFGKFTLESEDELTLELRDSTCSSVLAKKTFSDQSFDSEYTYSFAFNRIENSKDQDYCLTFNFVTNRPIKKDKAPRLFIDKAAQSSPYSLTNQGRETTPGAGAIAIRPGYTNDSFFSNTKEFFDRISQYKPVFLKGWILITVAASGIVLTFLTMALFIREEE